MHAGVRRMPAERARHAKRLGHAQPDSVYPVLAGSTSPTTPQESATPASSPTTTSPKLSSSNTLPSSSPAQSSTFTSSSASTSSTSSATPPASTQSPTVTLPSPSTTISSTTPVSTSSTSTPQADAAASTKSGLSGAALAGIIAGAAIVGAVLIVFFVRKTYLRRREHKRISWTGAPGLDEHTPLPDVSERRASFTAAALPPSLETYGQSVYPAPTPPIVRMQPPAIPTYAVPAPPQATYNNPVPFVAYPTQLVPSTHGPGNPALGVARVPSVHAQHAPVEAIVKCTFVPTLPDELSIVTGERIFIVEQYDDGWNLCANGRGERGMVPRECLEHIPSDQPDVGWRNISRMSSLNPDGRRF